MPFIPRPLDISFAPYGLSFGNVPESSSTAAQDILLTASSSNEANANITIVAQDPRFVITPSGNFTLTPGQTLTISVVFNSTMVLDSVSSQFFQFQGQGYISGGPALTATTVAGGVPSWNLSPAVINFGNLKIGTSSTPQEVTIKNGTMALTINTVELDSGSEFTFGGLPATPFNLAANATQTFTITANSTFRGLNDYAPGLTVTPSDGPVQTIELIYTGFLLSPVYPLTGNTQGVLFGLAGQWAGAYANLVAQSDVTLAPEAQCTLSKMHDFGNPSSTTYANRLFIRTECYGAVTVTLASTGVISGSAATNTDTKTRNATTDSTGVPVQMIFDVETNGEIHNLLFTVSPNAGILVLDEYNPCYELRGSVYESS